MEKLLKIYTNFLKKQSHFETLRGCSVQLQARHVFCVSLCVLMDDIINDMEGGDDDEDDLLAGVKTDDGGLPMKPKPQVEGDGEDDSDLDILPGNYTLGN